MEIRRCKELFKNINGYELDYNQKKAIVVNEENNLVIAGAGSGKTLTIVGKIRYLIEVLGIKKEEILCISFTNDCVRSLKSALIKNFNYDLDVYTFHKLSLDIIRNNNKNVSICCKDTLEYIIDEFFHCIFSDLLYKKYYDIYPMIKRLIITFINLFKSNNYNVNEFDNIFNKIEYNQEYILLRIIKKIYVEYESELNSKLEIDFNDMINKSIDIIRNGGYIKNYKYIIIDEYQDTSLTKYNLIKEIKKRVNAKLFAVGDDFQSIYRFTGCNLDIFLKFDEYYGYSKTTKIVNTYRNSKELIFIASTFIMKNKNQLRKSLKSNKSNKRPIKIIYVNNYKEIFEKLIINVYNKYKSSILILGRNNKDIYKVINDNFKLDNNKLIYIKNSNIDITYLTVHKSKGLESDNVILINLEDNNLGFPSKIENNKVLNYVLNEKDYYPYEEERRLFYVALTRTKNNVYLLVNKKSISIFVKELIKDFFFDIEVINKFK